MGGRERGESGTLIMMRNRRRKRGAGGGLRRGALAEKMALAVPCLRSLSLATCGKVPGLLRGGEKEERRRGCGEREGPTSQDTGVHSHTLQSTKERAESFYPPLTSLFLSPSYFNPPPGQEGG